MLSLEGTWQCIDIEFKVLCLEIGWTPLLFLDVSECSRAGVHLLASLAGADARLRENNIFFPLLVAVQLGAQNGMFRFGKLGREVDWYGIGAIIRS